MLALLLFAVVSMADMNNIAPYELAQRLLSLAEQAKKGEELQSFHAQACDLQGAGTDLLANPTLLNCLNTVPGSAPYPSCAPANQAAYASFCSGSCAGAFGDMVTLIEKHGCTINDFSKAPCTSDAMCSGTAPYCSKNGGCDVMCVTAADCHSCGQTCEANGVSELVCTSSPSASYTDNIYKYLGEIFCAKNSNGDYCLAALNGPAPAGDPCTAIGTLGCCAGLLGQFEVACSSNAGAASEFEQLKANCTQIDWTATCGLVSPVDCCTNNKCGGMSSAIAPQFATFLIALMLSKMFW